MRAYFLTHLSDAVLLRDLATLVARERSATAAVVAHIGEVDARRLFLPAGYASMYDYCVGNLHLSEQAAMKRIRAGRAAQRFPRIFTALAEGQVHLSAVILLAPHLTAENVDELLSAATHRTSGTVEHAAVAGLLAPARVATPIPRPKALPLSPGRFALQFTIGKDTHDKLCHVQAMMSHQLPSGDIAQVFDRALDALAAVLERQKFSATRKPRRSRRPSTNIRHIPAQVKRAVWQRDRGQCTFVGESGRRCSSRRFLEYDHIDPVARGGQATLENVRLRCRAHNQYQAERAFGERFMDERRENARRAAVWPLPAGLAE